MQALLNDALRSLEKQGLNEGKTEFYRGQIKVLRSILNEEETKQWIK